MSLVDGTARSLGSLGPIGPLAFGCWRLVAMSREEASRRIHAALDAGMNLVDNADVYGLDWGGRGFGEAEEILGSVLAAEPGLRDRMVLATKGGILPPVPYDSSPDRLRQACEDSLRRLQTDVIDLYQIHRPDLYTHPADVAATLTALHEEGKVREVGVSNHTPDQVEALAAYLPFPLVSSQPEFSVIQLDPIRDGTLDLCMRDGIVPLAWSPLAGGRVVSGGGVRPELLNVLDRLADRESVDRATVAMAFLLAHPSRPVVITGSMNLERIAAAPRALSVRLDRTDVYEVVQALEGVPLP